MKVNFDKKISEHAFIFDNVVLGNNVTIMPGAVIGRPPVSSGATTRKNKKDYGDLIIGDDCVIGANAVIYSGTKIGKGSMVCDTACIREEVEIGDNTLIAMAVTINTNTNIGSNVKIMDNTHITGNAVIENNVFIGMLVTMANDNSMGRGNDDLKDMLGPTIREGAIIGQASCLLPGVIIGENSIVGANSVVTKDVEKDTLVMGVPAKKVSK